MTLPSDTAAVVAPVQRREHLARRVLRNPVAAVASTILVLIVLVAIFAPLLAPYDANTADIRNLLAPPSSDHLLGTDGAGRDVLSRLIAASQFSLAGAALALIVSLVIGVIGGLLAGYFAGWIDLVSGWIVALLMALPGIIVLLAARAVIGPSLWASMIIFGVLISPAFFRLVHASVRAVRSELYVDAARVSGLSDARIIRRHILAVVRAPIIIQAALVGGIGLAMQSGLEFLGLGDIRVPTWGSMLSDGFANLYRAPLLIVWPAAMIAVVLLSLTLLGNAIRDELDGPRVRSRRASLKRRSSGEVPPPVAGEILRVTDLSIGYPRPDGGDGAVVHGIDLVVRAGEVHGLVGESGSGKTQTAWAVLGLLPPGGTVLTGCIQLEGEDLLALDPSSRRALLGRRIGYIPQEPMSNLDPAFTIGAQLVEPMRVQLGLSRAESRSRALALLARVGIVEPERVFDSYPHQVSGGMAQRVLIAGAVSCEPDLLIADEATTALDVTVQAEVLDLLRGLQAEMGMAVVLVTHNFGVVADLCDRVSVMKDGLIVETGAVREIFHAPQHEYTKSLLASILHNVPARGPWEPAPAEGGTR